VSKRTVFDKKIEFADFGTNFAENMSQIENKVGFRVKKNFRERSKPKKNVLNLAHIHYSFKAGIGIS